MILAGGRGSRLHELTKKVAKPAVHFGGKYRIIDFPLSNCANSDINTVGVLTQYESVLLNSYVARDHYWGLDTNDGGVYVLTPREKDAQNFEVYRGTADAITANLDFLDSMNPEYILVLSGDHIYKMNYDKMLDYHKEKQADATIAVREVPLKEASRFGIMNCDKDDMIVEFEEKPAELSKTIPGTGVAIDDSLAQFAINKPQEAPVPEPEKKAAKTEGKADAVLAASLFHFNELPVPELKKYLKENNIPVRI